MCNIADIPTVMERHGVMLEIISSELAAYRSGRGYVRNRVRLLDGPHTRRELFFSYCPIGAGRETASLLGLALTEKDVPQNVGRKLRGIVDIADDGETFRNIVCPAFPAMSDV